MNNLLFSKIKNDIVAKKIIKKLKVMNIEEKKTSMRAKQLWQAIYKKGLSEFNDLKN